LLSGMNNLANPAPSRRRHRSPLLRPRPRPRRPGHLRRSPPQAWRYRH
jgi:hypothetical protein